MDRHWDSSAARSSAYSTLLEPQRKERILLVDDEPQVLVALEDELSEDFLVYKADSAERALDVIEQEREIAVVISDQRMPKTSGDELFSELRARSSAARILVTGYADISAVIRAVNNGKIFAYVTKPWHADDLRLTVHKGAEYFRLNKALADERKLLSDLMNNVPDGIYFKDHELRIVRANRAFVSLLDDGDPNGVVGKRVTEISRHETFQAMERAEGEALKAGRAVADLVSGFSNNGVRRWFSTTKAPIRNSDGKVLGMVGIVRDVTERLETEDALRASEERLRLMFVGSNAGLYDWDILTGEVKHSPSLAKMLGEAEDAVLPRFDELFSRIHPDHQKRVERELARHLRERSPFNKVEFKYRLFSGEYHWFEASGQAVWNERGEPTRMVGSMNDITERKTQEERIARLTHIHTMLSGINSAIVRVRDRETLLRESCSIAVHEGGLSLAFVAAIDHESKTLKVVASDDQHPELVATLHAAMEAVDLGRGGTIAETIATERPIVINDLGTDADVPGRSELLAHESYATAFFPLFSDGRVESVFALFARQKDFFDSEEVKLLTELAGNISFALNHLAQGRRLNFLAYYDELTGLPKRALLMDRMNQQIVASRKDGRKLAVVLLDIGRFRHVNETLGRTAGDELLQRVAERLKTCVGAQDTLARFDSKSFAALIRPVAHESEIASWVEKVVLPRLNQPFSVRQTELRIAFHIAIASFPSDGVDADSLVANAEAALTKAKASGGRYVFYAPSMNERVAEKLSLETRLRRALERDEFVLHYQPKVELKTGRVVGLEALIRWQDPEAGLVAPGRFIPVLEETGLIVEAGSWVLERAAAQFTAWRERELDPPRVAVNVSAIQLGQPNFLASIERMVDRYPLSAGGIDIEITESVLMEDFAVNVQKLQAVKQLGLRIAIDDFGTGYSSLGYLSRLPIDALKIDRSFVTRMADDPQEMAIVTTVISLAHALELKVIAEGVETPNQAQLLRLLKCDQIQGYLVARPCRADDVQRLLEPDVTFRW